MLIKKTWMVFLGVAVIGVAMSTAPVFAAGASVSGFVDLVYTVSGVEADESTFSADGEVDVMSDMGSASVRADLDINKEDTPVSVEQLFFSAPVGGMTLTGGQFNTRIGFEGPDAPGLLQTSYGQLSSVLADADALGLTGVMLTTNAGGMSGDVFMSDDNTLGAQVRLAPMGDVSVSVGYVDSDSDGTTLNVMAIWTSASMLAAFEYVDNDLADGWAIYTNYNMGDMGLTVRYDSLSTDDGTLDGNTTLTVAGSYSLSDNLGMILEFKSDDSADDLVTLEAVATF